MIFLKTAVAARGIGNSPGPVSVEKQPLNALYTDLNGDKKLDLVGVRGTSEALVMPGDGTGKFGGGPGLSTASGPTALAADFDGDGNPDLAVAASGATQLIVALGDGKGGISKQEMSACKLGATALAAGDVDRDGKLDLVTAHRDSGLVLVARGLGGGRFAAPSEINLGGAPNYVRLADWNGDANLDIAIADVPARTISILLGDGKGGFAAPVAQPGGVGPVQLTVGDFNKDRRPDLLAIQLGSMSELTLLMNTSR